MLGQLVVRSGQRSHGRFLRLHAIEDHRGADWAVKRRGFRSSLLNLLAWELRRDGARLGTLRTQLHVAARQRYLR